MDGFRYGELTERGVMIDLNQMVERFLGEAVRQCVEESPDDDAVIRALNNRNESAEIRRTAVLKWLRSYSVLRRLNNDEARTIGDGILEFADARGALVRPLSEAEIIEKFTDLHEKYRLLVRPKKDQTPRDLVSLTSKALWCCYPDAIPIYDSNARCALGVLSRLMGLDRPADAMPYTRFLSVWFNLYDHVTIDDDRLGGYPYKVKVFDRILWIIGQPDYGQPAATAR